MPSLNKQILIGVIVGVVIGALLTQLGDASATRGGVLYGSTLVAGIFVDLLKMVLIPLIFSTIVMGIANLSAHQQMHRVWTTTLIFFAITVSLAMILSFVVMNIMRPGEGMHLDMFQNAMANFEQKKMTSGEFFGAFSHSLFQNPFKAFTEGNILAVVIFALFLGIGLVVGGERYKNILNLFQEFLDLMMRIIGWIMYVAPYGICALLIKLVATQNAELLGTLAKFIIIVMSLTLIHGAIVLPLILYILTKKSPLWFWRGARQALITAFATSSSSATLPVTLHCTEHNLKVRKEIVGFVVPLGATVNMDGTALYEAAAALFIANLAGIDLLAPREFPALVW